MKKVILASLLVFQSSMVLAGEISETWNVGDNIFTLKNEEYNEEKITAYNNLCKEFHKADRAGTESVCNLLGKTEGQYWEWAMGLIQKRSDGLKEGTVSLVLLYKNEEVVGGTYYLKEQEGKVIRVSGAGYRLDLNPLESGIAKKKTMDVLSSKKYFPEGEKLIVALWKNSDLKPQLMQLEFNETSYDIKEDGVPEGSYQPFEREIIDR